MTGKIKEYEDTKEKGHGTRHVLFVRKNGDGVFGCRTAGPVRRQMIDVV
ncbi:MAG: hypothetical protein HDR28_08300 [Lachnospiraceae bacterium]|nr:hypothetical protein [Lachnospiraceae bacterium]